MAIFTVKVAEKPQSTVWNKCRSGLGPRSSPVLPWKNKSYLPSWKGNSLTCNNFLMLLILKSKPCTDWQSLVPGLAHGQEGDKTCDVFSWLVLRKEGFIIRKWSKNRESWVLVAHTCNPSYSGGRDQEDHGSKPAPGKYSSDSISKIPNTKQSWHNDSVIEHLLSKHKVLSSNPNTAEKNCREGV
jgi:hypothetical protein